jgi:alpha-tubulin suppressor-like RCC1 family protein
MSKSLVVNRFSILFSLCLALAGTSNAAQIAASSGGFTLQVVTGGAVWAWGNNQSGQLGDGTVINHAIAEPVTGITSVTAVAAGGAHSLALKNDGTVWAWGSNSNGQLGDGTLNFHLSPNQVPGLSNVIAIAAGQSHSLALEGDGTVWAWGNNGSGQVGDGTSGNNRLSPVQVTTTGFTNNILAIAAGANHNLAIVIGGSLWAWGQNTNGQVGDGTTTNKLVPIRITGLGGTPTAIAGGTSHSLAIVGGVVWD